MKSRMLLTCILATTLFAALAVPTRLAGQDQEEQNKTLPHYTVTDLGTLGGTFSSGKGINNKRWVNGFSTLPGDTQVHAFLWRNGVMTDLGTLGGPTSFSFFPLNDRGEVTGGAEISTPDPNGEDFCGFGTQHICLPFLWQEGMMTPLPTLGGRNGTASEINNRGQAAGVAENSTTDPTCVPPNSPQSSQSRPVVWENGKIQELPTPASDPDGFLLGINNIGQVVGGSNNCSGTITRALLWRRRDEVESENEDARDHWTVTDLGNLGGAMNTLAAAINNRGQVTGRSGLPGDTTFHAFLWQKGAMTDLGTLAGDFSSETRGINENAQLVGGSQDVSGNQRAVLWQNGVMTDLNTLIPASSPLFLQFAAAINSRGEIAGDALLKGTTEAHAFLAIPCDQDHADAEGCWDDHAHTPTAVSQTSPKVVLPENVRKRLQQRRGFGRFGAGPMRP